MYEPFYGLTQRPFAAPPDPDFLVATEGYSKALAALLSAVNSGAEVCVVAGETGCGKTLLVHTLLKGLDAAITVGKIQNTHSSFQDVAERALLAFGQKPPGESSSNHRDDLLLFLLDEYSQGRRCLLVIDEAQNLTTRALEDLSTVIEINRSDILLQVVLVGQPQLRQPPQNPALQSLGERVALTLDLLPLSLDETTDYVAKRLQFAGALEPIFTASAIEEIHRSSGGIPRLINTICDLSLVYGLAERSRTIDAPLASRVVADRTGPILYKDPADRGAHSVPNETAAAFDLALSIADTDMPSPPPTTPPAGLPDSDSAIVSETGDASDAERSSASAQPTSPSVPRESEKNNIEHQSVESPGRRPEHGPAWVSCSSKPNIAGGMNPAAASKPDRLVVRRPASLRSRFLPRN